MNELNYASLEASKKLVDNGIVLETEKYFEIPYEEDSKTFCQVNNNGTDAAVLPAKLQRGIKIPRPCFTEVWRELPEYITKGGTIQYLEIGKTGSKTYAAYDFADDYILFENPTDALIDLLIFIRKEKS